MRDTEHTQHFHYRDWEDWQAGMFANRLRDDHVDKAADVLRDPELFARVLDDIELAWPIATAQNLSNIYRNHQPWCGRAATCYEHEATMYETNKAWANLTCLEQRAANRVADRFTFAWRSNHLPGQIRLPI